MSRSDTIINRALKIFSEEYIAYTKEAILWLEVHTGEKSKRSIYELKDALDHLAVALEPDVPDETADKYLNAASEHLRRAAVEPAEWLALEELQKLLKIRRKGFWWWRIFLLKPPTSKEFDKRISEGQDLIAKGRHFKALSLEKSYNNLKTAYITFRKLSNEMQPAELYSRIFALLLALVFFVLGVAFGFIIQIVC